MHQPGIKIWIVLFFIFNIPGLQTGFSQTLIQHDKTISPLQKRKIGDPLKYLPANIEVLTLFGERADISPDNKQVAFMAKTFGDAMVIDVKSKNITCLTCNIPAATFVRAMHLSTGDYLLIGPEHFENATASKKNNDLWFLSKIPGSKPVKIGQKVSEGVAVSKTNLKIAFTEMSSAEAQVFSKLVVAELDLSDGIPKLINKKTVVESMDKEAFNKAGQQVNKIDLAAGYKNANIVIQISDDQS